MNGKKIFLIWADGRPEIIKMISELEENGHQVVYWVGAGNPDLSRLKKHTIYHDHYAAWAGRPAKGINLENFPPPNKNLLERLSGTESIILSMMNKKFDSLCVDERKHIYYSMLRYWYGIINEFNPEVIVFPSIPHTVYNYLISELALLLGIKTIMFEDTWVANRVITYADWKLGSEDLRDALRKNYRKNFSVKDLGENMRTYYYSVRQSKDYIPEYMIFYNKKFTGLNWFRTKLNILGQSIKQGNVFHKLPNYILKWFKMNLEKEYINVETPPDFSKKFVYVPLGFQPERTTSPQGGVFVDQILMIETLSTSLPKDWVIYVKEHPGQWMLRAGVNYSSSRYPGYYKKCAQVKNVKIVPINTSSHELISKSQAVALTTGTAGFEAILKYKPVIIFGYPWYRDFSKIFMVNGVNTCREAFTIINGSYNLGEQDIINYLKSFEDGTLDGFLETVPGRRLDISLEESMKNITNYILKKIQ